MNVTYNPDTARVEWAPYRGDYGAHYAHETIELIEEHNCVKGCTRSGTEPEREEFGPGGNCHILAMVALGDHDRAIPELDPRPAGPHCDARQVPVPVLPGFDREEFERATAGIDPLFPIPPEGKAR